MKIWTSFSLLIILFLTGCSLPGNNSANPTPTIVRLEQTAQTPTGEAQPAKESVTEANLASTATPLATAKETATPASQPEPPVTSNPTATPQQPQTVRAEVVTIGLNVREGPGADYLKLGTIVEGDKLDIIAVSANGNWLQMVADNGKTGWISAKPDYTRLISGRLDDLPVIEATVTAAAPASTAASSIAPTPAEQPAIRPNSGTTGSQLIFITHSGGDLYAINTNGTGLQKLAGEVIDPVVSPDEQQIAFTRWDSGEMGTLYVMNIDGSNERAVLGETLQAKSPTWSPDGQDIIVSFQHGGLRNPSEECRRYKAGKSVSIPDNSTVTSVTWIGDKDTVQICFILTEDLQWGLRQVNLDSGQFEDLPADLYSFSPAWDPNQPWRVLYNTDQGLMQLDINADKPQPVTDDFRDKAPVFSPDGQQLALSYNQHDHWEVYTYNLANGDRQRLTKPPILADPQYNSAAPVWSPDGSKIAFVTDRSGSWQIWVMNADGSEQRPLFAPEVQAQLDLNYQGVNERLLNWIGNSATPPVEAAMASGTDAAAPVNLSGDWDFSFGSLALNQRGSRTEGSYQWYGGGDTGQIEGVVVAALNQFQGTWVSDRSPTSQRLLRWQLAPDGQGFSGKTVGSGTAQQWCGVRSGQPLPDGCGFSGTWNMRFGNPSGTGQATLVQTGPTVQGTYVDGAGQTGEIEGTVSAQSITEMKLIGNWRDAQGQADSFEWRLDLTTGRTFQGRRNPGNSDWCGWRIDADEPKPCGWED